MRTAFLAVVYTITLLMLPAASTGAQEPKKLPRVLILGDSISLGYTDLVRKELQGTADVLRPRENCQHTAYGLTRIKAWLGDGKWDVIHFNWGIWDTHMLSDQGALISNEAKFVGVMHIRHSPEKYRENLVQLVDAMEKTGAKLIWASTTPFMSRAGKRFDDIKHFNTVAEAVLKERKIAINDLYTYVLPNAKAWQAGDKVHFNGVGNENLAKRVSASIRKALEKEVGEKNPKLDAQSAAAVALQSVFIHNAATNGQLLAGVAKVDITDRTVIPVNDPLYVKALVLKRATRFTLPFRTVSGQNNAQYF